MRETMHLDFCQIFQLIAHAQPDEQTPVDDEEQTGVEPESLLSPPGLARELGFGAV